MVLRTAEMMRGPPLAPTTMRSWPLAGSASIMGDIELSGFLPGRMKLASLGASPYTFSWPGVEKSSIWLFSSRPATTHEALQTCCQGGEFSLHQDAFRAGSVELLSPTTQRACLLAGL